MPAPTPPTDPDVFGRLAGWFRSLPPRTVDVVLTLMIYIATVSEQLDPDGDWRVFVLGALASVPLVWRRRWPIPVALLTGIGTTGLAFIGGLPQLPFGQLLSTYTFALYCGPLMRALGVLGTIVGVSLSVAVAGDPLIATYVVLVTFGAAYTLGIGARARQDRIAMLEERAARLTEQQARLTEQQQRVAAAERERIARDMHDIVVHSVSVMVVQAEAGAAVAATSPDRAVAAFEAISEAGREAMTQLRRTLGVLRGGEGDRSPLPDLDAIPGLVDRARHADLVVDLREDGDRRPIPTELGVAAYRVVQEALTNTIRHAGAGRVEVDLLWLPGQLRIEVTDDGHGPNGRIDGGGHGLVGMRERVTAHGGELATGAGPAGVGYQVTAVLPLDQHPAGSPVG